MAEDNEASPRSSCCDSGRVGSSPLGHHPALVSRLITEHAPIALVALDGHDRVLWLNPNFLALLDTSAQCLVGKRLNDIVRLTSWVPVGHEQRDEDPVTQKWQRVWFGSEESGIWRVMLMAEMSLATPQAGIARMLVLIDLPERQVGELPPFSNSRTGLASQWVFEDRLRHAMEQADRREHRLSLLLVRLDRADDVRKTHGEPAMQRLLLQVGGRLANTLRSEDSIAYQGKACWSVLLGHPVSPENVHTAVLRCLEAMDSPLASGRPPLLVSLSIGIAMYPDDGSSAQQLMSCASQALGQACPGGYAFFDSRLEPQLSRQVSLRHFLQEALMYPDRAFEVVYQPRLALERRGCIGVEAVVRCRHPELGMLWPDVFMPIVSEISQTRRLGEWVIDQVLIQHRRWQKAAGRLPNLAIGVSLDASLLGAEVLEGRPIDLLLRQAQMDLTWLSLEIDARTITAQVGVDDMLLRRLLRMGVRLVVDRLGGAPVDMTRLAMLPVSQGKIDRQLVGESTDNPVSARLVARGLSGCLRGLQLETVMMGVDTRDQLEEARLLGIHEVQGGVVGSPMAVAELEQWLSTHQDRSALPEEW